MKRILKITPVAFYILLVSCAERVKPLPHAHAHNDYMHQHPLLDALNDGFISVEVDVHAIDGVLYVAHDEPTDLSKTPTLTKLYMDPLVQRIKENKGKVYPGYSDHFYLMIDIKTEADTAYYLLRNILQEYEHMLSVVTDSAEQWDKPVKVFISGERPFDLLVTDSMKFAGLDGRPDELGRGIPAAWMPVVSQNYNQYLSWNGEGNLDQAQLAALRRMIAAAHLENKKVRLWAAPDTPKVWQFLLDEGIDLINTDDLSGFKRFAEQNQ